MQTNGPLETKPAKLGFLGVSCAHAAEAKAARLDVETKTRVADADRREREAARTVDQARRLLADAAARLARPVPELPATNPRE